MQSGENVYIRGFGSFVIKKRAKKVGRNIKKGKSIEIPEHFIPATTSCWSSPARPTAAMRSRVASF